MSGRSAQTKTCPAPGCGAVFSRPRFADWSRCTYCSARCRNLAHNSARYGISAGVPVPGSHLVPVEQVQIDAGEFLVRGWILRCVRPRPNGRPCGARRIVKADQVRSHRDCGCGAPLLGERLPVYGSGAESCGPREPYPPLSVDEYATARRSS